MLFKDWKQEIDSAQARVDQLKEEHRQWCELEKDRKLAVIMFSLNHPNVSWEDGAPGHDEYIRRAQRILRVVNYETAVIVVKTMFGYSKRDKIPEEE